jgi:uncharacterized protein YdaT
MPWTPREFAEKHNQKLSGEAAKAASRQANALLAKGLPEGEAIATASKQAKRRKVDTGKLYDHPRSRKS